MKIVRESQIEKLIEVTSALIEEAITKYQASSIYLPAGNTPIPLYDYWERTDPDFLKPLNFIQMDEVETGREKGVFRRFFEQHLPSHLPHFHWIDDGSFFQGEIALLGLGLNGHVAFHEPHLTDDFTYGEVELSERTIQTLNIEDQAKGLSYGLGAFLATQEIFIMVLGEAKRAVLEKLISQDPKLPATKLLAHPRCTILTDLD